MHGFPRDLDLTYLVGLELDYLSIGPFNLVLAFETDHTINILGEWRLFGPSGQPFDSGILGEPKDSYRVHQILQKKLISYSVDEPTSLKFKFEDGWVLEILDTNPLYEACSISPDIYI